MAQTKILTPTRENSERVLDENQAFHHLMPHLRDGRISREVFSKSNLARIPLDPDVELERRLTSASEIKKAAKVGVRGQGSSVGEAAPLQPTEKKPEKAQGRKKASEEAVTKAKARKRKAA